MKIKRNYKNTKVKRFVKDLERLEQKHNVSITHKSASTIYVVDNIKREYTEVPLTLYLSEFAK